MPHQGWSISLPYYLPIAGGRIIGFIPFPRVLVLCEMQSVSSRIWTRVVVSISYDDNHYTTGTSKSILYKLSVLFQIIQFSMSAVKLSPTVLFQAIQFSQTVLIQLIQLSISRDFIYTQLNVKTQLFQTIQFSISTQFSSIWPIDRTLSDATTPGQSGPWSDANEGVLRIPQSSRVTGTSPSDCLVSYPGHPWRVLPLCGDAAGLFYSPSRLGNSTK